MPSLLSPYRVLDLTDEKGFLCGKILGDLGADVIKIEKPGGDPARRIGPFYHNIPDSEKSLFWFAYNTSKRGITLNIETQDGKEIFNRLVKTADFVVESFPAGYMDEIGLGYSAISRINPQVIMTSITPFGQTGPYKDYKASDITTVALGGLLYICGDPDRPPVRCSAEQSYPQAGAQAAAGTMIAHYHRQLTGEGQHVDVSMQECIPLTLWLTLQYWVLGKMIMKREGMFLTRGPVKKQNVYPCQDGYVSWQLLTYQMGQRTRALVEWMNSEGMASDELKETKWEEIDMNDITQEQEDSWENEFAEFFLTHTKADLHEEAIKRGIMLFPSSSTKDLLDNRQLESRKYWVEVEHPEMNTHLVYPGAPYKIDPCPWRISRRAPLIGEHNEEIYMNELGFSKEDLVTLKQGNII